MKRVLIAGAAGFIGSNLVAKHLADGDEVVGLDNLVTGKLANLAKLRSSDQFTFIEFDVCDRLPPVSGHFDYVYHLASPASPPKYVEFPIETMLVNSIGTKNLLDFAKHSGARLLFASTSEVYGDPAVSPQPESYWGNVNPIGPRSVYDEAKRFGEALIRSYQRDGGSDAIIVRLFNTYGPLMDPFDGRVVSNFIRQALNGEALTMYGDGTQTRSFCFVDDTIRGLMAAMRSAELGPINIGNPREITLLELRRCVETTLDVKVTVKHMDLPEDDPKQRRPDIKLASQLLNWSPQVSLEEGIQRTASWMLEELRSQ